MSAIHPVDDEEEPASEVERTALDRNQANVSAEMNLKSSLCSDCRPDLVVKPRYLYFFSFGAMVAQGRFTTLMLRDLQMNDEEIGSAMSVGLLGGALFVPFWTRTADIGGAVPVLKLILTGHAVSSLLYSFLTYVKRDSRVYFAMFVRVLSMVFIQPLSPVADAYTLRRLGGSRALYGRERSWGSLSWGLSAVGLGAFMSVVDSLMAINFFIVAFTTISQILLYYSPPDVLPDEESKNVSASSNSGTAVAPLGANETSVALNGMHGVATPSSKTTSKPRISTLQFLRSAHYTTHLFIFVMFILEMGQSLTESLEFLFIVGSLGGTSLLAGVSVLVGVSLEVPLLFNSEPCLRRFGMMGLMLTGIFVFCVRVYVNTLLTTETAMYILFLEPMNGVYVAFLKMSSISYMSRVSPPGQEATAIGTLNVFRTLGQVSGTAIGAVFLQRFGASFMYLSFGALVIFAGVILVIIFYLRPISQLRPAGAPAPASATANVLEMIEREASTTTSAAAVAAATTGFSALGLARTVGPVTPGSPVVLRRLSVESQTLAQTNEEPGGSRRSTEITVASRAHRADVDS